ncbi:response regulator [Novosphingobium gossypii]|uniref:response regulator n=1 Tax=Novosphingobium gossypii TaxID=1604774 RepID=UPI003D1E965C
MSLPPTVLVVEDEPLILLAACDMVESAGYTTAEAANATRALSILAANPSIAILFTDIDMPGPIDGMALAFETQQRWPHIGIIITSGRWPLARHEIPADAVFLEKPYLEGSLVGALKNLLA